MAQHDPWTPAGLGGLFASAQAQTPTLERERRLPATGRQDPSPRGWRWRPSGPVRTQGPAGFHGNPHTVVRAGRALGSHLVQPQWELPPAPAGTDMKPAARALPEPDAQSRSSRAMTLSGDSIPRRVSKPSAQGGSLPLSSHTLPTAPAMVFHTSALGL